MGLEMGNAAVASHERHRTRKRLGSDVPLHQLTDALEAFAGKTDILRPRGWSGGGHKCQGCHHESNSETCAHGAYPSTQACLAEAQGEGGPYGFSLTRNAGFSLNISVRSASETPAARSDLAASASVSV